MDYMCPYSAKLLTTFFTQVIPHIKSSSYASDVQFIFRPQIQPWHPSSLFVHDAAMAVLNLCNGDSEMYWKFGMALMEHMVRPTMKARYTLNKVERLQ